MDKRTRASVLEWLESPANFKLITGGTKEGPVVSGKKLKKSDAYASLAAFVNEDMQFTLPDDMWDAKIAKARYESLLRTHKSARDKYKDPGGPKFALSEKEIQLGRTIEWKLNELCPHYNRWDTLYGGRQNVCPTNLIEGGLVDHSSEDEDNDTQSAGTLPPFSILQQISMMMMVTITMIARKL